MGKSESAEPRFGSYRSLVPLHAQKALAAFERVERFVVGGDEDRPVARRAVDGGEAVRRVVAQRLVERVPSRCIVFECRSERANVD